MNTHRYTWKELVKVGIVFCVLLCVFSLPYRKYRDMGYQYEDIASKTIVLNEEKKNSIDVAFLGDSQGWATYDPMQFYTDHGFTSYNACTPGQFPYDAYAMLKNVFHKQKPKLVVMDVNMIYTPVTVLKLGMLNLFPIFHYHNAWLFEEKVDYRADRKGFNGSDQVTPYQVDHAYMKRELSEKLPADSQIYLDKIYQFCKRQNSQLLLVNTISPLVWTNGRHEIIQTWCDENGVNYVDYNQSELLDKIDFDFSNDLRDYGEHVNIHGSKKICENLGDYIQKNYALEDHRKDSSYQEWNALAQDASEYD